jgi:alkylation response protein AidB-like acyl-CoA dehydrogenase
MSEVTNYSVLKGGAFIIQDSVSAETFIPEQITEDQLMVQQTVIDFVRNEIDPIRNDLEKQKGNHNVSLLEKMGELGLLGTHIPEEYGGSGMDTNTNTLICDALGPAGGFTVSFAVQTGIGMLPILYYGTEAQKQQYLPALTAGTL